MLVYSTSISTGIRDWLHRRLRDTEKHVFILPTSYHKLSTRDLDDILNETEAVFCKTGEAKLGRMPVLIFPQMGPPIGHKCITGTPHKGLRTKDDFKPKEMMFQPPNGSKKFSLLKGGKRNYVESVKFMLDAAGNPAAQTFKTRHRKSGRIYQVFHMFVNGVESGGNLELRRLNTILNDFTHYINTGELREQKALEKIPLEERIKAVVEVDVSRHKDILHREEGAIESYMAAIVNARRNVINSRNYLSRLDKKEGDLLKQLTHALEVDGVVDVDLTPTNFRMLTDNIYIEHNKEIYDIGVLEIDVKLKSGQVNFENHTRKRIGMWKNQVSHPHDMGNNMCLGDIGTTVPNLCAKEHYAALAALLINYARSVNTHEDDAGKTITRWPTIKRQEVK